MSRLAQALSILDLQTCAKCLRPSNMQKKLENICFVLFSSFTMDENWVKYDQENSLSYRVAAY